MPAVTNRGRSSASPIPVVARRPSTGTSSLRGKPVDVNEECCICCGLLSGKRSVSLRPCQHNYHQTCLTMWFETRPNSLSQTCPLCRTRALSMIDAFGSSMEMPVPFGEEGKPTRQVVPPQLFQTLLDITVLRLEAGDRQEKEAVAAGRDEEYIEDIKSERVRLLEHETILRRMVDEDYAMRPGNAGVPSFRTLFAPQSQASSRPPILPSVPLLVPARPSIPTQRPPLPPAVAPAASTFAPATLATLRPSVFGRFLPRSSSSSASPPVTPRGDRITVGSPGSVGSTPPVFARRPIHVSSPAAVPSPTVARPPAVVISTPSVPTFRRWMMPQATRPSPSVHQQSAAAAFSSRFGRPQATRPSPSVHQQSAAAAFSSRFGRPQVTRPPPSVHQHSASAAFSSRFGRPVMRPAAAPAAASAVQRGAQPVVVSAAATTAPQAAVQPVAPIATTAAVAASQAAVQPARPTARSRVGRTVAPVSVRVPSAVAQSSIVPTAALPKRGRITAAATAAVEPPRRSERLAAKPRVTYTK